MGTLNWPIPACHEFAPICLNTSPKASWYEIYTWRLFMTTDFVTGIDERMWTEKEAAYLLHVSPNTLWLWRKQKKITFFRLANGTIRYRKSDIEMFLRVGACLAEEKMGIGDDN
jgi:hypothetical protein